MELTLDGTIARVYRFQDDLEMPWFQATPIAVALGYRNPTRSIADLVESDDIQSLQLLIEKKGLPQEGPTWKPGPLGYHDGKANYFNECGLYSLISKKKEAKDFKKWITREVLPVLRRHGFYKVQQPHTKGGGSCGSCGSCGFIQLTTSVNAMQLALTRRDEELRSALEARDAAITEMQTQLRALLVERDAAQLQAIQRLEASLLRELGAKFSNLVLQLAAHIKAAVMVAVKESLALKGAPKRRTPNAASLPPEQVANSREAGPLALGLSTVALEIFEEMPFAVFRKIRSSFGHHAKQERLRLHGLGERHAEYVEKPLLWAYTGTTVWGGGARYTYLQSQRPLLLRVFQAQLPTSAAQRAAGAPRPTESLEQRAHRLDRDLSDAERSMQWPEHVTELEPRWDEALE